MTTASFIGITVAICGNILISLALNFQKLAHKRLDREKAVKHREQELETRRNSAANRDDDVRNSNNVGEGGSQSSAATARTAERSPLPSPVASIAVVETAPLLLHSHSDPSPAAYGTRSASSLGVEVPRSQPPHSSRKQSPEPPLKKKLLSRFSPFAIRPGGRNAKKLSGVQEETQSLLLGDSLVESPLEISSDLQNGKNGKGKEHKDDLPVEHGNESDYLKSKLW